MNKIFDIIPPLEKGEHIIEIKKEKTKKVKGKKEKKPFNFKFFNKTSITKEVPIKEKVSVGFSKKIIFPLFVVFILLVIMSSLVFSKVDVTIVPKTETLTFNTKLEVSSLVLEEGIIKGIILNKDGDVSKDFESTGKTLKKAEGIIRVYNLYSSNSLTFREGTRFMSDSGKIFIIKDKAVIPGKPEYIDLKVVAAEAGDDYNIEPSMFSVPGLVGTAIYDKFYGRSFSSMTGGGEFSKVSEEDLVKAKEETMKEFTSVIREQLIRENSLNTDYLLLDDAFKIESEKAFSLAKVGDESDSFKYTIQGKGKVMIFKKSEVEDFVNKYIISSLVNKDIEPDSLEISYFVNNKDLDNGNIVFDLEIKAKVYSAIDDNIIKEELFTKSKNEAIIVLESFEDILDVNIDFWPFWINKIPKSPNRINIILNFK